MNGGEEDGDDAISDSELFRRAMRDVRPLESRAARPAPAARGRGRAHALRVPSARRCCARAWHAPGPLIELAAGR